MTTTREQLELAAKAYWGDEIDDIVSIRWSDRDDGILFTHPINQDHNGLDREFVWAPHRDQADSDLMACKLRMHQEFFDSPPQENGFVYVWAGKDAENQAKITHNNTDEDVCCAVREARLAVAVEIGRAMP